MYEYFYMHNEEIDLCWRAQNIGYKIYVCPLAVVYHLGGGSLETSNPKKTYYNFRNNLIMNTRNMPAGRLLWLIPLRIGLDTIAALRLIFTGKAAAGTAIFKAIIAYGKWLILAEKDKKAKVKWPIKRGLFTCKGVLKGAIVWNYFVRRKNTFSSMGYRSD